MKNLVLTPGSIPMMVLVSCCLPQTDNAVTETKSGRESFHAKQLPGLTDVFGQHLVVSGSTVSDSIHQINQLMIELDV